MNGKCSTYNRWLKLRYEQQPIGPSLTPGGVRATLKKGLKGKQNKPAWNVMGDRPPNSFKPVLLASLARRLRWVGFDSGIHESKQSQDRLGEVRLHPSRIRRAASKRNILHIQQNLEEPITFIFIGGSIDGRPSVKRVRNDWRINVWPWTYQDMALLWRGSRGSEGNPGKMATFNQPL